MCFINGRRWDTVNGQRSTGQFVALFADKDNVLFGIVRHVKLTQFGHFMMGRMKVGTQDITLSGSYGADGLPRNVDEIRPENRKLLTELPAGLADRFWMCDDGWNSAGSIGPAIVEWGKTIARKYSKRRW